VRTTNILVVLCDNVRSDNRQGSQELEALVRNHVPDLRRFGWRDVDPPLLASVGQPMQ